MIPVAALSSPDEARRLAAEVLGALPAWFGRPEATARYVAEIPQHRVLVAGLPEAPMGFAALRPHFDTALEIWLIAVRLEHHRKGAGRALITRAAAEARGEGRRYLTVLTMSARAGDAAYAQTRAFYAATGFRPLLDIDEGEPPTPMTWMIADLTG